MSDALVAVVVIAVLVGTFWAVGLGYWTWLWALIVLAVVAMELIAKLRTGRTLSQQFWAYRKRHPKTAWAITALLAAGWAGLLIHLNWR